MAKEPKTIEERLQEVEDKLRRLVSDFVRMRMAVDGLAPKKKQSSKDKDTKDQAAF